MIVEKKHLENFTILYVEGLIKLGESAEFFSSALENVLKNESTNVIIDFTKIDYIDSTGIAGMAFLVGFVLMFAILVLNFGNFRQPGILVATMPLFLTGALAFLLLSGLTMSFMVDLGFFGLIGVGLAHIIYLVNRFNELFESSGGKGDLDAIIVESVKSRLEPVFLTTAITALGLFVLAASDEMWRSFALAFAGGLIVGTTITLVFIPCALKVLYREDVKPKKKSA